MRPQAPIWVTTSTLTLNLLTTTIGAPPSNGSKWQMGFNSAFKGLNSDLRKTRLAPGLQGRNYGVNRDVTVIVNLVDK